MLESLNKCLSVNLNDYENIDIDLQINKVLFPAFVVFCIMMIALAVYRNAMRDLVVKLIRHEAFTEDSAKTLEDLGLAKSLIIPYLLSRENMLSKIVKIRGKREYTYEEYLALSKEERLAEEKIDVSKSALYIPEESSERARHIKEKYMMSKAKLVLACVFVFLIYIIVASSMSEILNVINNLLK